MISHSVCFVPPANFFMLNELCSSSSSPWCQVTFRSEYTGTSYEYSIAINLGSMYGTIIMRRERNHVMMIFRGVAFLSEWSALGMGYETIILFFQCACFFLCALAGGTGNAHNIFFSPRGRNNNNF